ncbi:uncharacterized protein LOC129601038 isoform X2 [Paramacrobiotus metropolitanus]|nr:uncharacterized protein LOC129601038 isoform X2 [Paramacrobiotus metropolitanus]XP_055355712.1 uncharacterized protein LOC129601038 isoform X2 [Paramacrobiotus metropolitanus]XP_055355713.1 uncharacterized protein LOC129601038 isoform X2 [Paramacrobiotus metropolitanus]
MLQTTLTGRTKILTLRHFIPNHYQIRHLLSIFKNNGVSLLLLCLKDCEAQTENALCPWFWHRSEEVLPEYWHRGNRGEIPRRLQWICCRSHKCNLSLLWSSQRCRWLRLDNYKIRNVADLDAISTECCRFSSSLLLPVTIVRTDVDCLADPKDIFSSLIAVLSDGFSGVNDDIRRRVAATIKGCLNYCKNGGDRSSYRHLLLFRCVINVFQNQFTEPTLLIYRGDYNDLRSLDVSCFNRLTRAVLDGICDLIATEQYHRFAGVAYQP